MSVYNLSARSRSRLKFALDLRAGCRDQIDRATVVSIKTPDEDAVKLDGSTDVSDE